MNALYQTFEYVLLDAEKYYDCYIFKPKLSEQWSNYKMMFISYHDEI